MIFPTALGKYKFVKTHDGFEMKEGFLNYSEFHLSNLN